VNSIFKYFKEPHSKSFVTFGEYFEGAPDDVPLITLLGLNSEDLKPFTKELLSSNELSEDEDIKTLLIELSRGINALYQFQDILDIPLDEDGATIINRHYAYYESLVYLRESVVSWLDKNVLGALTLLRPFLELSVLHLYWHVRCNKSSFKPYYDWLEHNQGDKGRPKFQLALNYVLDNAPAIECVRKKRLHELKQVITNMYKGLCEYHHSPKLDEPTTARGGGFGNLALESFLYYLHAANILLYQVVYLFILTYPMSLFPVNRWEKWGFNKGPVGLFFDSFNCSRLEVFIGTDNTNVLRESFKNLEDVQALMKWFNGFPDLTNEEIDAEWGQLEKEIPGFKDTSAGDLRQRLALMRAFNRGTGWALNYVSRQTKEDEMPDEVAEKLKRRLRKW